MKFKIISYHHIHHYKTILKLNNNKLLIIHLNVFSPIIQISTNTNYINPQINIIPKLTPQIPINMTEEMNAKLTTLNKKVFQHYNHLTNIIDLPLNPQFQFIKIIKLNKHKIDQKFLTHIHKNILKPIKLFLNTIDFIKIQTNNP